jgi:hypothetical protein
VAEEGVPFREIASVIGRHPKLPLVSKSAEEAIKRLDWFAHFAAVDATASSQRTRELLRWQPMRSGLIADLDPRRSFERWQMAVAERLWPGCCFGQKRICAQTPEPTAEVNYDYNSPDAPFASRRNHARF